MKESNVFEIIDKTKRKIRLTDKQWKHISEEHPELINRKEDIEETLEAPLQIKTYEYDKGIKYYYGYFKERKFSAKYLLVIGKYLDGEGCNNSILCEIYN